MQSKRFTQRLKDQKGDNKTMDMQYEITLGGGKKVDAQVRDFTISTDQPESDGGENSAPSPFELFLASLGTCAGYFVVSFCQARSIPTDNIRLVETLSRNDTTHMVETISIDILLPPDFPEKYKGAVIKAAESCTVKKHLASPPVIQVSTR
jgi:putative redox protein